MAISLDDLRALLLDRRDAVLAAVRDVLLRGDPDPFAMSYDDGLAMSEEERIGLTRRAHALREDLLEREFRERRATWIVMAGDDIVASGPDIEGCPDDPSVAEIGRRTGRFPFLFTRILVEEGASRAADLDTGSPAVFAPWEVGLNEGWAPTSMVWRKDRHLGMDYEWRPCRAVVGVVDAAGGRRRADVTVIAVRDWAGGPFVRVNANRRALVGRNLLTALGLRVLLLADSRETDVARP